MNNKLDNLNKFIENVKIPDELDVVIKDSLEKNRNRESVTIKPLHSTKKQKHIFRKLSTIVASLLIVFCLSVNTISTFAQEIYKIPLLGPMAKLITFREYSFENETSHGNVTIPKLELSANSELENTINALIQEKIIHILEEQAILDAEYKEAYLATGGTEESYHKIETDVDYRLNYTSKKIVSFMIWKYQTLAPAYNEEFYYNFDISTGKQITLKDLLGENYETQIKQTVKKEMHTRIENDPNLIYDFDWFEELAITEDRSFYIDNEGNIIIVFDKYEIAPGAMGKQEFKVGYIKEE